MMIGRHLRMSHDIDEVADYAESIGCKIFQIFTASPKISYNPVRPDSVWLNLKAKLEKHGLTMVIHASYTINLCHPSNVIKGKLSIRSLKHDLRAAELIGDRCLGVIIHMGKRLSMDEDVAKRNYVNGLSLSLSGTTKNIILETGASQGTEICSKLCDMKDLLIDKRIKVCLDTCHVWATGYDISSPRHVSNFFAEVDRTVSLSNVVCIHLNNSKNGIGSKIDRHADLDDGQIPINAIREVIRHAGNIPLITETPLVDKTFQDEIRLIYSV
jgi:deoxyribonuclease-4